MYNNILLAYNSNFPKDVFIQEIEKLGVPDKTEIMLLHVISQKNLEHTILKKGIHLEEIVDIKKAELDSFIYPLEQKGFKCTAKINRGDINKEILNESNDGVYEVIVLGNKKANNDLKNILGSVTHKISKRSKLPVLIIKEQ